MVSQKQVASDVRIAGIGYQGRSLDEVVQALRAAGIAVLIDVRELPWSRRADFSRKALSARLEREGIRYVHVRAAGNPREIRKSGAPIGEILARYREHVARNPRVLDEVLAAAGGARAALLCYEADVAACHRSVLLEALGARDPELSVDAL
jgi:uncharacterized protein (DUF488 family)